MSSLSPPHGGNLAEAIARFGIPRAQWLDLSTGINPHAYRVPALAADVWHRLPEPDHALTAAAGSYYGAPHLLPVAGTQAAIQLLPVARMRSHGSAAVAIASPTYGEHPHRWRQAGHRVRHVPFAELAGAVADPAIDIVTVCNPNNPTGECVDRATLLDWHAVLHARGGWLIVDEAFGDAARAPGVAAESGRPGLIVLRSVGKFFGLAGLRLGFIAAQPALLATLADLLGPWSVSGPAQRIGAAALNDVAWQQAMRQTLAAQGARLTALLQRHGIDSAGTDLFRWWPMAPTLAQAWQEQLAAAGIWPRLFIDAAAGLRLGLPPDERGWQRLEIALGACAGLTVATPRRVAEQP